MADEAIDILRLTRPEAEPTTMHDASGRFDDEADGGSRPKRPQAYLD
jgi:hypothetical protein